MVKQEKIGHKLIGVINPETEWDSTTFKQPPLSSILNGGTSRRGSGENNKKGKI
jgi:hypothetical protein